MANATITPAHHEFARRARELQVQNVRAMRGPNHLRLTPVLVVAFRAGSLAAESPETIPGFSRRLREALPEIDNDATRSWAHVLLATARELQRLSGAPVEFGQVLEEAPADDRWTIAIGFDEEQPAIETINEAARVLRDCIRAQDAEIAATVTELTRLRHRAMPGPTTLVMIEAARRRGIPVRRNTTDSMVQLGLGRAQRRLSATMTDFTSVMAASITSDKHWTKAALKRVGLAVPEGDTARTVEGALQVAEEIGFPLLLKPLDANNGRGISGRIDSLDGVREAFPIAKAEHPTVVVERFASGNDHRVVVVNRRVVACVERIPAHVVGDGTRTIRELAEEINKDPNRSKKNPAASLAPLPLDDRTASYLARSGRTFDTVPSAGEIVTLRSTANISTGGTAVDRTDQIHPVNRALCELAAGAVGLDVAGLDVLTPDISVPFYENGAVVIEVNASPGIRMHTHPDNGVPRDVPGAILDMIYPPGAPTTIPVVAITGTGGHPTATRLVAHLLRGAGHRVGVAGTEGVRFEDHLLVPGDRSGAFGASIVLNHPDVEIAVLETAPGTIVHTGLAYDSCDVGVVLGVSAEDLEPDRLETLDDLATACRVVAQVVQPSGYLVLNADDPRVLAMRECARGHVVLVSTAQPGEHSAVEQHVTSNGIAVVLERDGDRERVVIRHGERRLGIVSLDEVPLLSNENARGELASGLAAVAAAYVQGASAEGIAEGLRGFAVAATG